MTAAARKALVLTVRYGQHVDLSGGITLYVSRKRTDGGQGDQTRIVFLCPEEIRINMTQRYGPEAGTREQYQEGELDRKALKAANRTGNGVKA